LCRQKHRETGDGKSYLTILLITEVIQYWWQMNKKGRCRDTDGVKTKVIGDKPVPLPLSTTIPTWAGPRSNLALHRDRLLTNCEDHLPLGTSSQVYHYRYSVACMVGNQPTIQFPKQYCQLVGKQRLKTFPNCLK
jgi:hypothetical protein